jgi:hypothetical protein
MVWITMILTHCKYILLVIEHINNFLFNGAEDQTQDL